MNVLNKNRYTFYSKMKNRESIIYNIRLETK